MDQKELESRLEQLEAENTILIEYVRALITREPADHIYDAPFRVAESNLAAKTAKLPETQKAALTRAQTDLAFHAIQRMRASK